MLFFNGEICVLLSDNKAYTLNNILDVIHVPTNYRLTAMIVLSCSNMDQLNNIK